ncbi:MAG: peptidase U32 [Deltaproteobacteria bacterium]|nr:MAG: peptidase U32 [Deltaproteobacteria bacterium]
MEFSVACNFDPRLPALLEGYPVKELYGKLAADPFGGGRPSFYLPQVGMEGLESYVRLTHGHGIQFNYLLNSIAMGNVEYSRYGQKRLERLLGNLDDIGVDAVTVSSVFLLRLIKRRHPRLRVRIGAHMFTDSPRKVRFWVEQGADEIVVNEVSIHREFEVLKAMQQAAGPVTLELIVNNWCRTDCAIANTHATGLNAASQNGNRGFPLDYCSLVCNWVRLQEPVNYLRANWIRPEDLELYERMGYRKFKIVERNTPTAILVDRVHAYTNRRYDGNLLDLVQNYAYPEEKFDKVSRGSYSFRRMLRYFVHPGKVNLFKFTKLVKFGKTASVLYPLRGPNPVQIPNRLLDGFMKRFETTGCQDTDCESCRYCHEWAERVVRIDPQWKTQMEAVYNDLFDETDGGGFWESHLHTLRCGLAEGASRLKRMFLG